MVSFIVIFTCVSVKWLRGAFLLSLNSEIWKVSDYLAHTSAVITVTDTCGGLHVL